MITMSPEQRISVLLKILGDDLSDAVLGDIEPARVQAIRNHLAELDDDVMGGEIYDDVLAEFERLLRFALSAAPQDSSGTESRSATGTAPRTSNGRPTKSGDLDTDEGPGVEDQFVPSGHLQRDLTRISPVRLAAVLEHEHAVVCALILQAMDLTRAGEVLDLLPPEKREAIFQVLKKPPSARRELLDRLLQTTIERATQVDLKELQARRVHTDNKLASILRAMNRNSRFELLTKMAEEDPEAAQRIRDQIYLVSDLERMDARTIQKILGRVDTATLGKALKDATPTIQEKIMGNLSKRAATALKEEMEFLGRVDDESRNEANLRIIRVMLELDEKGEVTMES